MIGFVIAGLIIGALARAFRPGHQHLSVLQTMLLGLIGSMIGGLVANMLGTGDILELNVIGFVVAVITAFVLIGVGETASSRRAADRTDRGSAFH